MILSEVKWSYLFHRTYFRACLGSFVTIGKNVLIKNSRIIVSPGSKLTIEDNVRIENVDISIVDGILIIGKDTILGNHTNKQQVNIESGQIIIGHHSRISAKRLWIRFGGIVTIGNYTNINEGSEIRCDECVTIGSYNQISYNVNIWDTNTHNILPINERRMQTECYFPYFGKETNKPLTSPVNIGDDCWLSQNVAILKGTDLGDAVIIGYNCIIPGKKIPHNTTVVMDLRLKIIERD